MIEGTGPVEEQEAEAKDATEIEKPGASGRVLLAMILALTFAAYLGTLGFDFVYDDTSQIVENHFVQSWQYVPRYFTEHVWNHLYPNVPGNYYRPLFLLWLLINHTLFGLNPAWWHFTTVLTHLAATFMVYLLAHRILKDRITATVAALIFGLHPVHIEAVSWISGVTEPMLAVLLIPAFLFYLNRREILSKKDRAASLQNAEGGLRIAELKARINPQSEIRNPQSRWLALSLALYALALLSKETAVVLPMIIFAYEWIFGRADESSRADSEEGREVSPQIRRRIWAAFKCMVPYLALTAIYMIVRTIVLEGIGHVITPLRLSTILFTWPSLLWFYLKLLIWPSGLSAFYDTPYITSPGFSNFVLPAVAVIAAIILLVWWSKRSRAVAFAAVLLGLPVIPLLNLSVFLEGEIAHDRYLYFPSIGFSIIVAIALRRINAGRAKFFGYPAAQAASVLALASVIGLATAYQNSFWATELLLYHRGVTIAPGNNIAQNNLANELGERGMNDEAIEIYRKVLSRKPDFWLSNYNIGYRYYKMDRFGEAEFWFRRAIEINSLDAEQHVYLGLTLMKTGRLNESVSEIRRAINIRPDAPGYHYALGVALRNQGQLESALDAFEAELKINPKQSAARQQIAEINKQASGGG